MKLVTVANVEENMSMNCSWNKTEEKIISSIMCNGLMKYSVSMGTKVQVCVLAL